MVLLQTSVYFEFEDTLIAFDILCYFFGYKHATNHYFYLANDEIFKMWPEEIYSSVQFYLPMC